MCYTLSSSCQPHNIMYSSSLGGFMDLMLCGPLTSAVRPLIYINQPIQPFSGQWTLVGLGVWKEWLVLVEMW